MPSTFSYSRLNDFPTLKTLGVAVEYFPRYVNTHLRLHAIDVVLMSVIVRGRGRHVMGDRVYAERSGSVGITHYGQVHDILTGRRGMDVWNVYLDLRGHVLPAVPDEFREVLSAILPLHPRMQNRLNRSVHFSVRDAKGLAELLARIGQEQQRRPAGYVDAMRLAFQLFLIECCREARHSGIVFSPDARKYPAWLDRVRLELDRSYALPLSLDHLAEDARVSKGHLCRLFKAYTGKTVFEYLIQKRIGAAMLRLRSSREKVLAIAMECGFNDIAYFTRTFRRVTGQSPRQYRQSSL